MCIATDILQEGADVLAGDAERLACLDEQGCFQYEHTVLKHVVRPIVCHDTDGVHVRPQRGILSTSEAGF
jgi:hypothetical protein